MPAPSKKRILVVEDDRAIARMLMPGMDGFQVAAALKGELELHRTSVIFLTARDSPLDMLRGVQVGARHYLTKPFEAEQVRDKVAEALK
jgi:CheY-like chemotaxis protein